MRHLSRLGLVAVAVLLAGGGWGCGGEDGGGILLFQKRKNPRPTPQQPPPPPPPPEPEPEPDPVPPPPTTEGWTELTPSSDTLTVYVSSSTGNDANNGLSTSTPKATIAAGKALVRANNPDWLLLKAGDTWTNQDFGNWTKSGRSATEPMVISSYGTGARPRIRTGNGNGMEMFGAATISHVAIVGLHFDAHLFTGSEGSVGLFLLAPSNDILVEDCRIEGYSDNLVVQGNISNFRLRRSVVADSYSTASHSQGLYADGVDGLLIEGCLFDHNGWRSGVSGAEETIFNHNVYIQSDCTNVTIRGNIIARASSHGLQLRPGGTAEENLFLRNALAMFAAGEGTGPALTSVVNNVVLDGKAINGSGRGAGIQVFDSRNALLRNNIVAHKPAGVGDMAAFIVQGQQDDGAANYVILFEDNIAYEWSGPALETEASYTGLTVRNNIFQDLSRSVFMIEASSLLGTEVFQNNIYRSNRATTSWFRVGGTSMGLSGWVSASGETGAMASVVNFTAPDRTVATYQTSLGRTATLDAFLAEARLQSKANWRPEFAAPVVNDYVRAGFGR